jgi:hypothetical protein
MFTNESSAQADLTERLTAFNSRTPDSVIATNPLTASIAGMETPLDEVEAVVEEVEEETEATEPTEETEAEETEDSEELGFDAEFESRFGIKPEEALTVIQELQNFRNEMSLMRQWGVSASEYDTRITSVKEFYNSLPEEGREQFNSPEGAVAIWNHISANAPKAAKRSGNKTRGAVNAPPATPKFDYKRSQINAMDTATLQKNWSSINKAYLNGRILED